MITVNKVYAYSVRLYFIAVIGNNYEVYLSNIAVACLINYFVCRQFSVLYKCA